MWLKIRLKPKVNWLMVLLGENVGFRHRNVAPVIGDVLRAGEGASRSAKPGEPPGTNELA